MTAFYLYRQNDDGQPTLGRLEDEEHRQVCLILEPPDANNSPNVSCIPATGDKPNTPYHVKKDYSEKHHRIVPCVQDVPGRTNIEMHIGCLFPRDTEGCQLFGQGFGFVDYADGQPNASGYGMLHSGAAFAAFMALAPDEFDLYIIDPLPLNNPQ